MEQGMPFGDCIVYVDESGHASPDPDPNFPCFVLAFCMFEKRSYRFELAPALQGFKFRFFGHDMAIIHEREIRKSLGEFSILKNRQIREPFLEGINSLVAKAKISIIHQVIPKDGTHKAADNLYHLAAQKCLETLYEKLASLKQILHVTHIVFEQRGKKEDGQLELEVRRICSGQNRHRVEYPFVPVFASKKANSTGLQFADLVARPLGNAYLYPGQPNRAYEVLREKDIEPERVQDEFWTSPEKQKATEDSP